MSVHLAVFVFVGASACEFLFIVVCLLVHLSSARHSMTYLLQEHMVLTWKH